MGRYSLNLRKPWQNPAYDTAADTIGSALSSYATKHQQDEDADREEQNKIAAIGGTPIAGAPQPSGIDRIKGIGRGIGSALGGLLHRGGDEQTQTPPVPAGGTARPQYGFTDETTPDDGGRPVPQLVHSQGAMLDHALANSSNSPTPSPVQSGAPAAAPKTVGEGLAHYTIQGRNGTKYDVDPMFQTRQQIAGREMEADAADRRTTARDIAGETRKQATLDASQKAQMKALTDSGMPEPEARARVLTNTVKYDDVYGPQRTQPLSFDERQKLMDRNNAAKYRVAQLTAGRSQDQDAIRRAQLELQISEMELNASDRRSKTYVENARAAESTIPKGTDRIVEESTPEGRARIVAAESTAKANRDSAGNVRTTGAADATAAGSTVRGTANRGKAFTPEQTQSRARQLKGAGNSIDDTYRIMRSEGYNVAPPRKPAAAPNSGNIDLSKTP